LFRVSAIGAVKAADASAIEVFAHAQSDIDAVDRCAVMLFDAVAAFYSCKISLHAALVGLLSIGLLELATQIASTRFPKQAPIFLPSQGLL
jgi:hypothetical protein